MKKAFTLPTCKTCQRIFDELTPADYGCEVVDIKAEGISAEDLDAMKAHAGSYEALFSRRAMKFRSMGLADKTLTEEDCRAYIKVSPDVARIKIDWEERFVRAKSLGMGKVVARHVGSEEGCIIE